MASLNARLEDIDSNSENVNIYISFNVSNCVSTKLDSTNFLFCTEVLNMVESHVFTGFLGGCIPPPKTKSISLSNGSIAAVPNPLYEAFKKFDRLLKGLETSTDIWSVLYESIKLYGEDLELMLQEKLQTIHRSSYSSFFDYLAAFKLICDKMNAIDLPLPDHLLVSKWFGIWICYVLHFNDL